MSLFLTRMMIVITVRMIPRLAMLMGRMEKLDPSHMYWTWTKINESDQINSVTLWGGRQS